MPNDDVGGTSYEDEIDETEQHETIIQGVYREALASLSRSLAQAKDEPTRLRVFENAVDEVVRMWHGLDRSDAFAALQDIADARDFDTNWVQNIFAEAVAREPPKANGNGHTQHAYGDTEYPPHTEVPPSDKQKPLEPFPFILAASFDGQHVPQRRWLVHNRIPMRNVTLLSGDGAVGKTTIALQLAVAIATEQLDWLQNVIDERGPVMFFTAEEEMPEVHFRLAQIVDYYPDLEWRDLTHLHLLSRAEGDCVLAVPHRTHIMEKTDHYQQLELSIQAIKPRFVILESAADLFAGSEIDRTQVRKFISLLRELAIRHDCAVMLLSHPSVAGMASGSGMAGSTQWNNAVRSRMYFKTMKGPNEIDEFEADGAVKETGTDFRELQYLKNNRAKQGDRIKLIYTDGLFLPEKTPAPADKAAQESKAEAVFLAVLRRFNSDDSGRSLSMKKGPTFAPALVVLERESKAAKVTKLMLTQAMERLIESKKIRSEMIGPPSHRRSRLIEVTAENTGVVVPIRPDE
jgi:RecA-family ATPase